MIFGDSASGKSTFAHELGNKLNVPVLHLDRMMDNIGRENGEQIKNVIEEYCNKDEWIIEGNAFTKDPDSRIEKADTVYVFKTLPIITLFRHIKRFFKIRLGQERRRGSSDTRLNLIYFIPYIFIKFPKRRDRAISLAKKKVKNIVTIKSYQDAQRILAGFQ